MFLLAYFYLTPVLYPASFIPEKELFGTSVINARELSLMQPDGAVRDGVPQRAVRRPDAGLETMLWLTVLVIR